MANTTAPAENVRPPVPERLPWQRQPGESSRPYACFVVYRSLGADRSLTKAVRHYLTTPGDKRATTRGHQQRRFQQHPAPGQYVKAIRGTWSVWSRRWLWVERCAAFDDHINDLAESERIDAALRARQAEIAEDERQRTLRLTEARAARSAGRSIIQRFLARVAAGELDGFSLVRTKTVRVTHGVGEDGKPDGTFVRKEIERRGLPEVLALAVQAIGEGQKLERLELGEVTDRTEQTERRLTDAGTMTRQIADAMAVQFAAHIDEAPDRLQALEELRAELLRMRGDHEGETGE